MLRKSLQLLEKGLKLKYSQMISINSEGSSNKIIRKRSKKVKMLSVMISPPTIDDQIENVLKSRGSHLQSLLQIQIQIKLLLLLSYLKKVDHHLCDILENHNGIRIFANNGSLAIRIDGKQCRKTTCFLQLCENFQLPYFY